MESKIKIIKKDCEIYTIRNGMEWGQICLSISGETVDVLSNSSFGTYSYWWGACGMNPKKFLTQISMHYAMEKFTNGKMMIPDPDRYSDDIKRQIIDVRRADLISASDARNAWTDLLGILEDYPSGDALYVSIVESKWFEKIFGDYDSLPNTKMVDPQCRGFWDEIWIPFVEELKRELAAEQIAEATA